MLSGDTLPTDRESVYWLNIKAIPSSSPDAKNELLIAVKSKMKLFYRPAGLKGDPSLAYQQLTFSSVGGKLSVHNPSPYSVSLYDIKVNGKQLAKPPMVLPFQTVSLPQSAVTGGEVSWRAINDFGGITAEHKFKMVGYKAMFHVNAVSGFAKLTRLSTLIYLCTHTPAVLAGDYFSPDFIETRGNIPRDIDISRFNEADGQVPGVYHVDVYVNGNYLASQDISFIDSKSG
ncbi:fimbrial chaperone protein [Citrobacter koseri]|uniref:Fimbrial chaperone protein n=1 Tax=Citrobacter koseri TaxID=545 RepID=A0A2X2WDW3_CITKO|nr:fimbrial chaperone protein [Citrobacter koseri]